MRNRFDIPPIPKNKVEGISDTPKQRPEQAMPMLMAFRSMVAEVPTPKAPIAETPKPKNFKKGI